VKLKPALRGVRLYNIGKEIKVPLVNRYRNPAQVGQDRLVSAYAGLALYGAPLIIADFGTAVNFDIISKKGEFLGGLILPGLRTALQALAQKTALLPEVQLKPPRELVGRDTQNGMLSGIVHGYACLTNELCRKLKKQLGKNTGVVATGGDSGLIAKYVKTFSALERNLTLKGLNLLFLKKTS
jgi:type III pantothenate kinase